MQVPVTIDIEDILRQDLTDVYADAGIAGVEFSAMPIPPDLGELPYSGTLVCIRRVGGTRSDIVVDTHGLSLDVYTDTWDAGMAEANRLAGVMTMLPYTRDTRIQYHRVEISTQPYALPDTSNPVLVRVRMSVEIEAKASVTTL